MASFFRRKPKEEEVPVVSGPEPTLKRDKSTLSLLNPAASSEFMADDDAPVQQLPCVTPGPRQKNLVVENRKNWRLADFDLQVTLGTAWKKYPSPCSDAFLFVLFGLPGTGTFGRVHLAQQRSTGQYFAMKVLKKADLVRLKQVEHINSERDILALVGCPFIVTLYVPFFCLLCALLVCTHAQ